MTPRLIEECGATSSGLHGDRSAQYNVIAHRATATRAAHKIAIQRL